MLIDIGVSRKKIKCKIGANAIGICKVYLTENEMTNFLPAVINQEMVGIQVEKIVFADGYQWENFESKW